MTDADLAAERWLPIVGHEATYEVSDIGRVRSIPRPRTPGGIRAAIPSGEYVTASIWSNGRGEMIRVHVLVAAAFVGPRPEGMVVRHLNGNGTDNRLSNLAYGTSSDNQLDTVKHGKHHLANRTHCSNGHEYTPANTLLRVTPTGTSRLCRECHRIACRASRSRTSARINKGASNGNT